MAMSSVTTRAPAAGLVFYQQETRHHREGPVHHVQEDPGPLRLVEGPHGFHRAREPQEPAEEEHRRDRDHDRDGHREHPDQDQDDAEPKQPSPLQRHLDPFFHSGLLGHAAPLRRQDLFGIGLPGRT